MSGQGITNFIVLPLTFLSGTFYSISRLPEFWQKVSSFNPFFYNLDGFRYAFTGVSDSSLIHGIIFLVSDKIHGKNIGGGQKNRYPRDCARGVQF